jgi:hypothetical protein
MERAHKAWYKRKQGEMGMGMGMGMDIMSRVFLISISKPELELKFIIQTQFKPC